jgi:hypothetical protein
MTSPVTSRSEKSLKQYQKTAALMRSTGLVGKVLNNWQDISFIVISTRSDVFSVIVTLRFPVQY